MSGYCAGRTMPRRLLWTAQLAAAAPLEGRLPFASAARLRARRDRRIARLGAFAEECVPHYREAAAAGARIATVADLARLPLLRRHDLQRDPERFLPDGAVAPGLIAVRSSGSTGEPVTFHRDPRSLFVRDLTLRRLSPVIGTLTGRRLRRRSALLTSAGSSTTRVNSAFERNRLLTSGRIDHRTFSAVAPVEEIARMLGEFRPHVVTAAGSVLDELYGYLLANRIPWAPRLGVWVSDPISPRLRDRAEDELGIFTRGIYQAIETPMIGFECEQSTGGRFHVNFDLCPVRIVKDGGADAGPGEAGEVVISNLVNRGTVLLNYALGDRAMVEPEPCGCGRTLPLINLLEGRVGDWLTGAAGERVNPQLIRRLSARHPAMWRWQVVQEAEGSVRIRAVVEPGADRHKFAEEIRDDAARTFGPGFDVSVEVVDRLARTPGGKVLRVERGERPA